VADFQSWSSEPGNGLSPGGFEFGVTGWVWPAPVPSSVTFYLDNTASVFDQHGRPIRGAILQNGKEVRFATAPPRADDSDLVLRGTYGTHAEVVEALLEEKIDLIQEMNNVGSPCPQCKGTGRAGDKQCAKCRGSGKKQVIACAGWPQLTYDQLKRLNRINWPFDNTHNARIGQRCGCVNCSIKDPALRKDALRARREADEIREKEMAVAEE